MSDAPAPKKVFFSYAHGEPPHPERVLALADALRLLGFQAILDQYDPNPAEGWPLWMDKNLLAADYVLMICTQPYYDRVMQQMPAGTGFGVQWEGSQISNIIYHAPQSGKRFIPILFEDGDESTIPLRVRGYTHYRLKTFDFTDKQFELLVRHLSEQPEIVAPPLGTMPILPPRNFGAPPVSKPDGPPEPTRPAPATPAPKKVFISYADANVRELEQLLINLRPLERTNQIDAWNDTRIKAGQVRQEEIKKALEEANVAVLLISADFLASDFIAEQQLPVLLAAAKEKGLVILPVILSPCLYEEVPALAQFQPVNSAKSPLSSLSRNDRQEVWLRLARRILELTGNPQ